MAINEKILTDLHNKFIAGTISAKEKQLLYNQYKNLFSDKNGNIDTDMIDNFLVTSHKSYGKPVNGLVSIV
jgi:uncharacterized protein (DUF488 family)